MNQVRNLVGSYPDFPKKGIIFRDILPVFRDPKAYAILIDELAERIGKQVPNCSGLVGIESRGFMLACPLALKMKLPFIPVRKPGKLPGETREAAFDKEYGQDRLQIQTDSVKAGATYVVVDDLLATGGTLKAACDLLKHCNSQVGGAFIVMELSDLPGRKVIEDAGYRLETLIKY